MPSPPQGKAPLADAVGEALSKQPGGRRTRRRGTGADWSELVCGGQGESKGQSEAEGMSEAGAVGCDGHRGRDRDVRGQAALMGAGGTHPAHPKAQGRAADPCLCEHVQQKGSFVFQCQGRYRTRAATPPHTPHEDGLMKFVSTSFNRWMWNFRAMCHCPKWLLSSLPCSEKGFLLPPLL